MNENNHLQPQPSQKTWLNKITQALSSEPKNKKQLINLLREAWQRKVLNTTSLGMIEGVLNVQEYRVKDVMVPRSQMITVKKNSPLLDIIPLVIHSGHSRFPVIGENKDEVLGILLAKDLLPYAFEHQPTPFKIKDILRPGIFIPESKRLDRLLQDFRLNHSHMAVVVDEYGGITGLITIEDVLEEIVGEIEDEYDTDDGPLITKESNNTYLVKALTPIMDFNNYFQTQLHDDVETIGGLITRKLGRLPKRGEVLQIDKQLQVKILRADNRRIHTLQITITDLDLKHSKYSKH